MLYVLLVLVYLAASGICTLSTGAALDPALAFAAAAPVALPALGDAALDTTFGMLRVLAQLRHVALGHGERTALSYTGSFAPLV